MQANNINTELLTLSQTKEYMKCSYAFIWLKRKEGRIQSVNAGKKVLVVKASIDAFLKLKPVANELPTS